MPTEPARPGEETLTSSAWGSYAPIAQMEVWGPSPLLRWSKAGKLQQQWYEQYRGAVEWRDVPDEEGKEATGGTLLEGVAEYFDWLSNAEIFADECANNQARDAYARASSELGLILIRKGIYQPEKPSNAKLCGGGGQP